MQDTFLLRCTSPDEEMFIVRLSVQFGADRPPSQLFTIFFFRQAEVELAALPSLSILRNTHVIDSVVGLLLDPSWYHWESHLKDIGTGIPGAIAGGVTTTITAGLLVCEGILGGIGTGTLVGKDASPTLASDGRSRHHPRLTDTIIYYIYFLIRWLCCSAGSRSLESAYSPGISAG